VTAKNVTDSKIIDILGESLMRMNIHETVSARCACLLARSLAGSTACAAAAAAGRRLTLSLRLM